MSSVECVSEDRQRGRPESTVFEEYPSVVHQASCGATKIGTYQSLKRLFVKCPEDETRLINVACGILSGVISSSIANPTDVLKVGSPISWASLIAQLVKNLPAMQESWVQSLGQEDPLEKGMATAPVSLPGKSYGQRNLVGYSP